MKLSLMCNNLLYVLSNGYNILHTAYDGAYIHLNELLIGNYIKYDIMRHF